MAASVSSVLSPDQLNAADEEILAFMTKRGRVTPSWIAAERELSRAYVSQRLKRLKEHGHVEQPYRGLWDLAADPRTEQGEDGVSEGQTPTPQRSEKGFHNGDEVVAWVREHQPAGRSAIVAEFHDPDTMPVNEKTWWENYARESLKAAGLGFVRNQGWQELD